MDTREQRKQIPSITGTRTQYIIKSNIQQNLLRCRDICRSLLQKMKINFGPRIALNFHSLKMTRPQRNMGKIGAADDQKRGDSEISNVHIYKKYWDVYKPHQVARHPKGRNEKRPLQMKSSEVQEQDHPDPQWTGNQSWEPAYQEHPICVFQDLLTAFYNYRT